MAHLYLEDMIVKELPVFYAPPENHVSDRIVLPADESHHAVMVMRLRAGSQVIVVDGLGNAYRCELAPRATSRKATVVPHHTIRNFGEPAAALTLAAGLSAGSKFDTVVEKGTELGVRRFVPIICSGSKVVLDAPRRTANRVRRLERVALAAMKQCRRSYRPEIAAPTRLNDFLNETNPSDTKVLFHPDSTGKPIKQIHWEGRPRRVILLVGPESGFTADELENATEHGFVRVSLGSRVLRTETAGPVACALAMLLLDELTG